MRIKELYLKNFGRFSEKRIVFGDGINVIYGRNESGKTTLYHAVGALLFGMERQRGRASQTDGYKTYQPWDYPTIYAGSMKFETGGKLFCIERNFYQNEKSARLFCETDGEELSVAQGDLEMLLGGVTEPLFLSTAAAGQMKMKPQAVVYDYLKNYIANLQETGSRGLDVARALSVLEKKRKELERQKKKAETQIRDRIAALEAQTELAQQELLRCGEQLRRTVEKREEADGRASCRPSGFWAALIAFLKRLFFRRAYLREREHIKRERIELAEKERILREQCGEKESLLEELAFARDALFARLHEQSKDEEIRAVSLAEERIEKLSALHGEEAFGRLLKKASETLRLLTGGKYDKIFLEEGKEPEVWDGSRRIRIFQVSAGCAEQVYLSLRIAMQDLFFAEETLPLIFDDAFAYFDEERLGRLLSYLPALDRQVILLTCHQREAELLDAAAVSYRKIML